MRCRSIAISAILVASVWFASAARANLAIYTIGNSLTWDTVPPRYATDWSIQCARNLQVIHDDPLASCVSPNTPWTTAFSENSYDVVAVQPYIGTTLSQDVSIISGWITMQPNASFVIHSGWTEHELHATAYYGGNPNDEMIHSPEYFGDLVDQLELMHPQADIRYNPAIDALESIRQDALSGVGPFQALSEVYRDKIHMTNGSDGAGRYLMHNLMRHTIGLENSIAGFEDVPAATREYLDATILAVTSVPEAGQATCLLSVLSLLFARRKWHR